MSKKAYKKIISGSIGSVLTASAVPVPPAVYAEELTSPASDENILPDSNAGVESSDAGNDAGATADVVTSPAGGGETSDTVNQTDTPVAGSDTGNTGDGSADTPPVDDVANPVEDQQEGVFRLTTKENAPIDASEAKFELLGTDGVALVGQVVKSGNQITFTPDNKVDDNATFEYKVTLPGYKEFKAGPVTFAELKTTIPVLQLEEIPAGSSLTLTNLDDNEQVKAPEVTFKDKDGQLLSIPLVVGQESIFDLSSLHEGDVVKYEILADGYKKLTGEFTVKATPDNIDLDFVPLDVVTVDETEINKVYGDAAFSLVDKLNLPADYDGTITYSVVSDEGAVSVSQTGEVTTLTPGSAVITVQAPRTDHYEAINATIPVAVSKKNLGDLSLSMIDWTSKTKVYDGNDTFQLEGKLKQTAGLVGDDEILVKATVRLSSPNVGTQATTIESVELSGDTTPYVVNKDALTSGPDVEVTAKEISVSLKDITVAYGSDDWKALKDGNFATAFPLEELLEVGATLTDKEQAAFDALTLGDHLIVAIADKDYKVGSSADSLNLTIKDAAAGNFKLVSSDSKADIIVTEDNRSGSELWDNVQVDDAASKGIYRDGDKVYVKPGGTIAFNLKDTSVYDTLNVKAANLADAVVDSSIQVPDSTLSQEITGSFYLSDSIDVNTRTQEVALPSLYEVDASVPVVDFLDGSKIFASIFNAGTTTFSDSDEAVKFAKANSENGYVLTLDSSDEGSGLKSLKYSLVKITSDEDAKLKVREAATADDTSWSPVENNAVAVNGTEEGYYIIIVKAKDNVGNEAVYASNGMVIDTTNPVIAITGLEDGNKLAYDNINYGVDIVDPVSNGVASGITKVDVIVKANGEKLTSTELNTNSFTLTSQDLYGVDEIDTFSEMELAQVAKQFTGIIDADSNNVTLEVVAYDRAGNVVSSNEISGIRIDKSKAEVTASYADTQVHNGKYVNAPRQLTVEFKDRNFNEANATVHVSVNGVVTDYTIAQIRNGEVPGVRLVSDRVDSQADVSELDYTNDRVNSYTFEIGDASGSNQSYGVDVSYVKNGETFKANFANGSSDEFIIDNTAPEVTLSFGGANSREVSTSQNDPTYDNNGITATITVRESNFDPKDIIVRVSSKNADGSDNGLYSLSGSDVSTLGSWISNGDTHVFVLEQFTADSNYSLSVEYTDLAGNSAATDTYYFTVDKTAPSGAIIVNTPDGSKEYTGVSSTASFEHVVASGVSVANKASDETSGVASVKYYLYRPGVNAKGEFSLPSAEELSSVAWSDWTGDLALDPNQQVVIYQRIEDKAGNVTYVNTSGAILLDNAAPLEPQITINTPASANNIYSSDVSASIHVEEQVAGDTYSGLNTVTVEVLNGDTVTQAQTYTAGGKADRVQSFDADLLVDARLNNSNFVTIRVTVTDWAGNTSTSERKLVIDTVAPRIEVVWDLNEPRNGRYYNQTRTATIRVYERNFDPNAVNIAIAGGNASISGWSIGDAAGSSDENVNIATITFSEDGDYTFSVNVSDLAGNKADYTHSDLFTIDKTVPTISVSWDKELINGRYVAGARTATITVRERNFDAVGMTADIRAMLEAQGIAAPAISGWSSAGDVHTATITFAQDGDYSFTLNYEDLAGNRSDDYNENEFTVDATNPDIVFENIQDGSSNRGEVRPAVRFSDRNFDREQISLTLKGYRHAEVNVTGSFVDDGNGGRIVLDDFPHEMDVDDVYTLTAHATDRAGNKTDKSITFSVNRFGSNYYFSEETDKYLDKYYHNKEKDIVIHEVNTDALRTNGITIIHDGSSIQLDEDDYTVRDISSGGWKEYVYTIKAERFAKEGRYEITIDSEDMAGNKQSNQIKEKPASFVIDKTNPSAVITGIEDGEIYNAVSREVGITVSDNVLVGDVELLLDGEVVAEYSSEDVFKAKGNLTYGLSDSKEWQVVQVRSTDAAGNATESKEVKVLITPDAATRTLNSLWFKVLGGGGATVSAGLLWFLIAKKKKKEKDNLEEIGRL